MKLFHSKGFCLISPPDSDSFMLCINDRRGNKGSRDFHMAPFHNRAASIEFTKPSIHTLSREELDELDLEDMNELHPAELNDSVVKKEAFTASVTDAQQQFDKSHFNKVIVARNKIVPLPKEFDHLKYFIALAEQQPSNFTYLFYSPRSGAWIGTTPELLLEQKQNNIRTMSLAGTRNDADYSWSQKELDEQNIVTEFIKNELINLGAENLNIADKRNVQSAHIEHLCNDISAKVRSSVSPLKIVNTLHPTPAVSGFDKNRALEFIQSSEPFARSFYSGYIGFMNDSHASLYVNLRCMRLGENSAELFAGAGITAESDPEKEYKETEEKMATLLRLI